MRRTPRIVSSAIPFALASALAATLTSCKKEEPPPPLPTAQSAATQQAFQLKPIDAAVEVPDAADKPRRGGGGRAGGGLGPCCQALSQNANLAPEPTKTYMVQAAALCQAAAAAGQGKAAAMGSILGALKGAGMPAACK